MSVWVVTQWLGAALGPTPDDEMTMRRLSRFDTSWGMIVVVMGVLGWGQQGVAETQTMTAMTLTSTAFSEGRPIPSTYACDGQDVSPPLAWTDPPEGTQSFALIHDDPDAPRGTWVHWVLYNLTPSTRDLPEAFPADATLPDGALQGTSSFGRTGYGGPCPPSGTHRYFFKLYALDTRLALSAGATAAQLEEAMDGHVLARTQLMGTYRRSGR